MKTLRLLRNIAALFILTVGLLASQPAAGPPHTTKSCGYKKGHSCWIDASGQCRESGCAKSPYGCPDSGCL